MSKYANTWKEKLLTERYNRLSEDNQAKLLAHAQKLTRIPLRNMHDVVLWLNGRDLLGVIAKIEEFSHAPKDSLTHYFIERVELNELTIKHKRRR